MTQEEKQLLLKDLCARLPYGVKYHRDSWNYEWDQEMSVVEVLEDIDKEGYINYHKVYKVEDIKPYLRPLSTMTDMEKIELCVRGYAPDYASESLDEKLYVIRTNAENAADFYNEYHFDYRGLIEKGLALEAPEGMYNV